MFLPRAFLWNKLVEFLDLVAIVLAFTLGAWLVHANQVIESPGSLLLLRKASFELALYLAVWVLVIGELGDYLGKPSAPRKALALTAASFSSLVGASLGKHVLNAEGYTFRNLSLFWGIHVVFLAASRLALPRILRFLRGKGNGVQEHPLGWAA